MFRRRYRINKSAAIMAIPSIFFLFLSFFGFSASVQATGETPIPDAGFEDNSFTGWNKGSQTGTLGNSITQSGTGVTIFSGSRTFTHSSHPAVGTNTSSIYYAPAVSAGSWTFAPNNATYAVALQPKNNEQTFTQAMTALGLSGANETAIRNRLTADRNASGMGNATPTDAAWITREVELTADVTYTMSWNYIGTDYVPFNDGSVTSLVSVNTPSTPTITVNNSVQEYALLGFTNPGTGDYSTNSYGATGWQKSTYKVSVTGTYKLGFTVFNLGDIGLSPVLLVDNASGTAERCIPAGSNCTTFGGVASNSPTAPTVAPTTTAAPTTTTTLAPATSLVVTSLLDDGSSGSLRWAITQANANSGGIYDSITFTSNGTITLASALPQITQSVTITGNGRTQTVVDGNNLYRPFNVASGITLTISNMTLKQGQATNGGLIYNGSGTVSATNVRFTGMSGGSAVFNNNNNSTATYTNSTFDYLNVGIAGDYGSTPQLAAGTTTWANEPDSVFTNKTYVNNCIFANNTYGINNYRFTKVENSEFTDNNYGANVTGLNRTQILDSTFTDNGIGIYHNSWIPTTFNMGTNNRLIVDNTFNTNGISIYLDDTYNNGQKNQSWATITGNTWDASGVWVRYYQWNGTTNAIGTARPYTTGTVFAQSNNTFPDTIGAPSNLTAQNIGTTVVLTWSAPTTGGYLPERYAIGLNTAGQNGWGLATGNVGDANALNTTYTIDHSLLESLMPSGTTWLFHIRSDNDTFGKYSANSNVVSLQVGTPPATTTVASTTPSTESSVTTVSSTVPYQPVPGPSNPGQSDNGGGGSSPIDTTLPPEPTPEPETESTVTTLPEETLPETESTATTTPEESESTETTLLPIEVEPEEPETEEVENPSDESISDDEQETISDGELEDILDESFSPDADAENVGEVLEDLFETDITDTQLDDILDAVFDEDVSEEVFTEAITTMLDADLTDEQLDKVLDSAFSEETSVENMVSALDEILDGPIDVEDLEKVMDAVFDGDLSDDETIALAEEVLKGELTADEFTTVIDAIFDEVVTDEVLLATFETVLETELDAEKFEAVVGALESEVVSSEQVAQVVTLIIGQEGGIPSEQATELATSAKVLESVDGEQATEVFASIVVTEVSEETGAAIAEALVEAPTEVKEAFEEEINVFAGVFDTYTAIGSTIDVGTRRSVIAVNLVTSTVALASAAGAIPTPGSNSSPSSPRQDIAARREEEPEEGGAIEGEGPDWIKSISIYKYENGVKTMDWKNFTKKFIYGVMGSGFTLAGAVVMYFTLSGLTQQIALWGTLIAFVCAMYLHMKEPEN